MPSAIPQVPTSLHHSPTTTLHQATGPVHQVPGTTIAQMATTMATQVPTTMSGALQGHTVAISGHLGSLPAHAASMQLAQVSTMQPPAAHSAPTSLSHNTGESYLILDVLREEPLDLPWRPLPLPCVRNVSLGLVCCYVGVSTLELLIIYLQVIPIGLGLSWVGDNSIIFRAASMGRLMLVVISTDRTRVRTSSRTPPIPHRQRPIGMTRATIIPSTISLIIIAAWVEYFS